MRNSQNFVKFCGSAKGRPPQPQNLDKKESHTRKCGSNSVKYLRPLLLDYRSEEVQVGVAVVDQAVRMTLGAVVALTRLDILVNAVHQHRAATLDDVDKLAVGGVGVHADRGAAMKQTFHNLALVVHISTHDKLFLATVEMLKNLLGALLEIDNHSIVQFKFLSFLHKFTKKFDTAILRAINFVANVDLLVLNLHAPQA